MGIVHFALSMLAVVSWVSAVLLVFPRLLAAGVCLVLNQAGKGQLRARIASVNLYPLSATAVANGVAFTTPDADVSVREVVFVCRWWRPWRKRTRHSQDARAERSQDASPDTRGESQRDSDPENPDVAYSELKYAEPEFASAGAAATFPAIFALTLEGLRVRVINGSNFHSELEAILRAADDGSETSDGTARSPTGPRGGRESEAPVVDAPSSLAEWLPSHLSLRVVAGAIYVFAPGRTGLTRVLVDAAKVRFATLGTGTATDMRAISRKTAARVSVAKLKVDVASKQELSRVAVSEDTDSSTCGLQSCLRSSCDCSRPLRGDDHERLQPSRKSWRRRRRRRRRCRTTSACNIDYANVICADSVSTDVLAETVPTGSAPDSTRMHVVAEGLAVSNHEPSIATMIELYERFYPPSYHLGEAFRRAAASGSNSMSPAWYITFSCTPRSTLQPLLSIPYMPRKETWATLHALDLRRTREVRFGEPVEDETTGNDRAAAAARNSLETLMDEISTVDVHTANAVGVLAIPSTSGIPYMNISVEVSDVEAISKGIFNAPFMRCAAAELKYSELPGDNWRDPIKATLDIALDSPHALQTADSIRVLEDMTAFRAKHVRARESVRYFIPFTVDLNVSVRNGFVFRAGVLSMNAWPDVMNALDEQTCAYAELCGEEGSFRFSSSAGEDFAPIAIESTWEAKVQEAELFLVMPIPKTLLLAPEDRAARTDERIRADADNAHTFSRRQGPGIAERVRHAVDDATTTFSRIGLASNLFDTGHTRHSAKVEADTAAYRVRLGEFGEGVRIVAKSVIHVVDVPLAVDTSEISARCGRVVASIGAQHVPYLFALFDNLNGNMTHCLSLSERKRLRALRRATARGIAAAARCPDPFEAFVLGLDAGRGLQQANKHAQFFDRRVDVMLDSAKTRLVDLPDAMCPFPDDPTDILELDIGRASATVQATPRGIAVTASPVDKARPGMLYQLSALDPSADQRQDSMSTICGPCVYAVGWKIRRDAYLDKTGVVFANILRVGLGHCSGSMAPSTCRLLAGFASSFRVVHPGEYFPAIDASWLLWSNLVICSSLKLAMLASDPDASGETDALLSIDVPDGFRIAMNNLTTSSSVVRNVLAIPRLSASLIQVNSDVFPTFCEVERIVVPEVEAYKQQLPQPPSHASAAKNLADGLLKTASLHPVGVEVSMSDRPAVWSTGVCELQWNRIRRLDHELRRIPFFHRDGTRARGQRRVPGIELFGAGWWNYASMRAKSKRDAQAGPQEADSTTSWDVKILSNVRAKLSGEALETLYRVLKNSSQGPNYNRHRSPTDEDGPSEYDGPVLLQDADIARTWRDASRGWAATAFLLQNRRIVRYRILVPPCVFELTGPILRAAAPATPDHGTSDVSPANLRTRERDRLFVILDHGVHTASVVFHITGAFEKPASHFRVRIPSVRVRGKKTVIADLEGICVSVRTRVLLSDQQKTASQPDPHVQPAPSIAAASVVMDELSFGRSADDLEGYVVAGRLLSMVGLLLRSLGMLGRLAAEEEQRRGSAVLEFVGAASENEPSLIAPYARAGLFSGAMFRLRNMGSIYTSRWTASHSFSVRQSSWTVGGAHSSTRRPSVLGDRIRHFPETPSARVGEWDPIGEPQSVWTRTGLHGVLSQAPSTYEFEVRTVRISILNEELAMLTMPRFSLATTEYPTEAADRGSKLVRVSFDSTRFSVRDDIVAELLAATTSIASHSTLVSANLVRRGMIVGREHELEHPSGPGGPGMHPPGDAGIRTSPSAMAAVSHRGTSRFLRGFSSPVANLSLSRAIKSFSGDRLRSHGINTRHRSVDNSDNSGSASDESNPEVRAPGLSRPLRNDSHPDRGESTQRWNNSMSRIGSVKVLGKTQWSHSRTRVGDSRHEEATPSSTADRSIGPSPAQTMAADTDTVTREERNEATTTSTTVLFACGRINVSFKHSLKDAASGSADAFREPDMRLVVSSVSASYTTAESSAVRSAVLRSEAISLMSRNEHDCIFRVSLASADTCMSICPSHESAKWPMLLLSIQLADIDTSLEAPDLLSVKMFKTQFSDDIKAIGDAAMDTIESVSRVLAVARLWTPKRKPTQGIEKHWDAVSVDIAFKRICASLIGFHPGDKAMRLSHEANSLYSSASLSDHAASVMEIGGRLQEHRLTISASHWSSEERLNLPSLEISGVQWALESARPSELMLTAGAAENVMSFQGVSNLLYAISGVLAFQQDATDTKVEQTRPRSRARRGGHEKSPKYPTHPDGSESYSLNKVLQAWNQTKSVRLQVNTEPVSVSLSSGTVVASLSVGRQMGIVEWNKLVSSGNQLHAVTCVPSMSLRFARHEARTRSADRNGASLALDIVGGRLDVLKSQSDLLHRFVFRLSLDRVESFVQPWQLMEDSAEWADEQDFIRDLQDMHLEVGSTTARTRRGDERETSRSAEHRLFEFGLELPSAILRVPLLEDEGVSASRLSLQSKSLRLLVRLGDEVALPSQLNLAKASLESIGIMWRDADLLRMYEASAMFAVRRHADHTNAHFGSLRGSVSIGYWVVCPRPEVALAIVDARIARQVKSSRGALARLGSLPERLTKASSLSSGAPAARDGIRLLFESIEVLVQPSPGYIEAIDVEQTDTDDLSPPQRPDPAANVLPPSPTLLPIPIFSVGIVRRHSQQFDLLDINFSGKKHNEFPDECLTKVGKLFSELFGAVASRTKVQDNIHLENASGLPDEVADVHLEVGSRDWSALVRFGQSRYTAVEDVGGHLRTRFAFDTGEGTGLLASVVSSAAQLGRARPTLTNASSKSTIVSGVSSMFNLEITPEFEGAKTQRLTLQKFRCNQSYANSVPPHVAVQVVELRGQSDLITLLLSKEWLSRPNLSSLASGASHAGKGIQPAAQQAALALASRAPKESALLFVLGSAPSTGTPAQQGVGASSAENLASPGQGTVPEWALHMRLDIARPTGLVGLKVKRVQLGVSRYVAPIGRSKHDLSTDVQLSISGVSSVAEWEHLSANSSFRSLQFRGDFGIEQAQRRPDELVEVRGMALLVHKLMFQCKRDQKAALNLEIDGAAAAARVGDWPVPCQLRVETTSVDAFISSSTATTLSRLIQLQSRMLRNLGPEVEAMAARQSLELYRADASRYTTSFDGHTVAHSSESQAGRRKVGPVGSGHGGTDRRAGASGSAHDGHDPSHALQQPGLVLISGDRLGITMHGFSFDDNQPQARLAFHAYDVIFKQRPAYSSDLPTLQLPQGAPMEGASFRRLELRYELLDIQYSDQRQNDVTVMSIPDPHLSLDAVLVANRFFVTFLTRFDIAIEASPTVSHYGYLRKLMSLYGSVRKTSLAATLSELEKDVSGSSARRDVSDRAGPSRPALASEDATEPNDWDKIPARRGAVDAVGVGAAPVPGDTSSPAAAARADASRQHSLGQSPKKWGGKDVTYVALVFAPQLRNLGQFTPDLSVVMGWLALGGPEALPAGLYDAAIQPLTSFISRMAELSQKRDTSSEHPQTPSHGNIH